MQDNTRQTLRDVLVFALLIGIGVVGRWAQPEWCFTPTAAMAVFAGLCFSLGVAVLVPVAILLISDLALPAYDSLIVMLVTYGTMSIGVPLGRLLRGSHSGWSTVARWAACALVPATVFYLVTNFAVWAFQSDYPKTVAGLVECYWAAVPFYRWMAAGDVFYLTVIFGCYALASVRLPHFARATNMPENQPASARLARLR